MSDHQFNALLVVPVSFNPTCLDSRRHRTLPEKKRGPKKLRAACSISLLLSDAEHPLRPLRRYEDEA